MADTTYMPKTYTKDGGDIFVIASGGEATVESGGTSTIESGGRLTLEETANFKFFDVDITGSELRSIFRSQRTKNIWSLTSMASTSTGCLALVPAYGYAVIKDIAAAESAYMSLSAAIVGDELKILTEGNGSNGLFTLGFSGDVSLYDVALAKMSSLTIAFSADNGSTFIHLQCFETGKWSIIEVNIKDAIVSVNANA